ncbi:MAG TPA: DoxX family protein, partial [Candidatus Kaiserbacteria bacterium]|nr:DoxX family protein [Candidatus Kaiserbacteria bacterium]
MLSVFPSLLILGIFAPFILRLSVGVYFFYTGYRHIKEEREILVKEFANKFKTIAKPLVVIVAIIEMILGLSLVAGFLTQIAAILGMIFALKLLWFKNKYPHFAKNDRTLYIIIFVILLSLLFTGAG